MVKDVSASSSSARCCLCVNFSFSADQELCMKHPLHRKKLQLALQALGSEEDDLKGKLDHNWVTSECDAIIIQMTKMHFSARLLMNCSAVVPGWLDDIGLPQYKSHFDEARVDGRVLHYMTVVSSQNFLNLIMLLWSLCGSL